MNLYKVTFVAGSKNSSIRVRAKNESIAYGYARQYGIPSTVKLVCSRWWHLGWVVLLAVGYFAGVQL